MKLLLLCLCLVCFHSALRAQDNCSLFVRVVTPQGAEERDLPITVEERDGRKSQKRYERGGVVFCDLGILPVTITVGHPGCNQVVIRDVPLRWGERRMISVTYDFESCMDGRPRRVACKMLFRFVDSERKVINGARLEMEVPYKKTYEADQFGRILVENIPYDGEFRGISTASGYDPVALQHRCTQQERDVEQYVTMNEARQ